MKIISDKNTLAAFSDAKDGDLSFYLMNEEHIEKSWYRLPVAGENNLKLPAFVNQIHGCEVICVDKPARFNQGAADAIVTGLKNQPVGVFTADCLPVLIFNRNVCAAVHAGWRGTRQNIVARTVERISLAYHEAPGSLTAHIGPCIGQCCLEMGDEVYEEFIAEDGEYRRFFERREKWHLNLRALNRFQLIRAGLPDERIIDEERCTFCETGEYFSFRRQRKRNGSIFSFVVNMENT
jgi:YfiH family protein